MNIACKFVTGKRDFKLINNQLHVKIFLNREFESEMYTCIFCNREKDVILRFL